ncbi:Gfo/Idh/MocA family protein [Virgibacillus salexigens]|uniref:Oxidoreductase n=3 Tax=Virgibacillus TaxID=84406 RepID=A0ABQ2DFS5_9BACI|nr:MULTISPECIES: Gfo/Idh/MocA family oxidoreductase [Virgibacillus]MYL41180.1 gfo/Idh/MocA family oxidoreductase [Virgibacillus massiliensis]GGJ54872.1 oxidoreductase [Virgibacillus kapii]CDQ38016.1 putative oxidoreductase YcjS [Virgibacillus massiliensis]
MNRTCDIVLVGIAGYGEIYLNALEEKGYLSWIKGVVDINPERSNYYTKLQEMGIPCFASLELFYQTAAADLAIISSPIHFHAEQTITAMENGSHVLCEKPIAGSVEEVERMRQTRDKTGRFLAIGFNWSFSTSVHLLKEDIQQGLFGKPLRGQSLVLWPRTKHYYQRSNWAGKRLGPKGEPIYDSIANNAASHFLHHLVYVLGKTKEHSAKINTLEVEVYRANPIETFDTCALRAKTDQSVELLYLASHAVNHQIGPNITLECEHATITYEAGEDMRATWEDGTIKSYGDPETEHTHKLDVCIQAALNEETTIPCSIEAAYSHLLSIEQIHHTISTIARFPDHTIKQDPDTQLTYVPPLAETLLSCYQAHRLPSEIDAGWAQKPTTIRIPEQSYPY